VRYIWPILKFCWWKWNRTTWIFGNIQDGNTLFNLQKKSSPVVRSTRMTISSDSCKNLTRLWQNIFWSGYWHTKMGDSSKVCRLKLRKLKSIFTWMASDFKKPFYRTENLFLLPPSAILMRLAYWGVYKFMGLL